MEHAPPWPVTLEIPVAWGDMDAFGHVNNTTYLRWFESARIAYFARLDLLRRMKEDGIGPILARATVDFRKPVVYPDQVSVSARVPSLGNTSFAMAYRAVSRAHGALVAEGDSVVVMVDYRTGTKQPLAKDLRDRIAALEGSAQAGE